MEKRMEKYTMRHKMKAEERKARLDNERRKQAEAVAEKRRRLVDEAKVPDSKPTKATISRAEKVCPIHPRNRTISNETYVIIMDFMS